MNEKGLVHNLPGLLLSGRLTREKPHSAPDREKYNGHLYLVIPEVPGAMLPWVQGQT